MQTTNGFQKGVQNWKLRSKHGRDKIFNTPQILWEAACEYFQSVDDNPWYKIEVSKSGESAGDMYEVPTILPYTIFGMCTFWGVSSIYWTEFKGRAKDNYPHFLEVIRLIDDIIINRKYTGATTGHFNAQFIGKDIGLVERSLVGSDPDNPLPGAIQFYLPTNGREVITPITTQQQKTYVLPPPLPSPEIDFILD